MGIVNLTDDSFFSGSRYGSLSSQEAVAAVEKMFQDGASIVDIGACSTRPGAEPVSPQEEWERLKEVIKALAGRNLCISVDTTSAEIVRRVYDTLGSFLVNDISSGEDDPGMLPLVGSLGLEYVAMHKRGNPRTMQQMTDYPQGVTQAVKSYFEAFARKAQAYGIHQWILDPGFGFAKTLEQNWELLGNLHRLTELGRPILAGLSRKSMIYKLTGTTPEDSLPATQIANYIALVQGATLLRVHDIPETVRTVQIFSETTRIQR